MKKQMVYKWLSGCLALIMLAGCISLGSESTVSARKKSDQLPEMTEEQIQAAQESLEEDDFTTESGSYIDAAAIKDDNLIELKGKAQPGEHIYTVKMNLTKTVILLGTPMIQYAQKDVKDKTKFTLEKEGKVVSLYQIYSGETPFDELNAKTDSIMLPNHVAANTPYYMIEQILNPGTYTFTFEIPEKATDGAKIYLGLEGSVMIDEEQAANTKATAREIPVPTINKYNHMTYDEAFSSGAGYMAGEEKEYWYTFTLPADRYVELDMTCIVFNTKKTAVLTLYYPDGTEKVYKGIVETDKDADGESDLISLSNMEFSKKLKKGTYYIKVTPGDYLGDGLFQLDVDLPRAAIPKVTYWALGKKIVKGTGEPGSKAYAKMNGKTYYAKKKTTSDGKFSIPIPAVKAGTKIAVRVKDSLGVSSRSKTVTVRKIPKKPTLTEYKAGTKKISGKCVYNGTVTIKYNGKTYKVKSSKKGKFTVNTAALKSGRTVKVFVRDISGNVSKTRTYKIK